MSVDLSTRYLRHELKNPVVVSACPLTGSLATLQQIEQAGAAAVVMQSVFAEQIEHDELEMFRLHTYATESSPESSGFFPELAHYNLGSEPQLEFLEKAKRRLSIPIIASLNGTTPGKWVRFAKMFEIVGADAIELNIYLVATDPTKSAADIEQQYVDIVHEVTQSVEVPVAVKLGPYFSSLPNFSQRMVQAGASGLVLFNRYLDPEIDLATLRVKPHLELSTSSELRLVLRWLGILRDQVDCSLAATSGIHTADDAIKALLAGANVTMMASALLKNGVGHVSTVIAGIEQWLTQRQYQSVKQLIGSVSRDRSEDASTFERANYMKALVEYTEQYH